MPKKETADSVQAHTEAKLQFYTKYLERYLQILLVAQGINKINIYDLYCGAGQYSDGNTGSALRAVDAVWKAQEKNKQRKVINLHLNDLNQQKIKNLRRRLSSKQSNQNLISISFSTVEAFEFLKKLEPELLKQDRHTRNLLFIDPYGYKDINRQSLEAVMSSGKTEIVLFLPIEQMYRFRNKTKDDVVDKSYIPLKHFIEQFGLDVTSIESEKGFITALESALSFDEQYYSASYSIRNHTGHHYGMFFITSNLLGLEKIIEVKWELDSQQGQGFTGENQIDFFLEMNRLSDLKEKITEMINIKDVDNRTMYEFVLKNGFRPKHANEVLRMLCDERVIHTIDANSLQRARKGSFKLNYQEFKSNNSSIIYRAGAGV